MVPIPKAVRVRTSSGWQDIALVGPAGPAGGVLDARRIAGQYNGYQGPNNITTAIQMYTDSGAVVPLRLAYTPPIDCWWDVGFDVGIVQKNDANYHYCYGGMQLTPPDVDGVSDCSGHLVTQHASVNQYEARQVRRLFKLAAGVPYVASAVLGPASGGSWSYYAGSAQMWMEALAYARGSAIDPANRWFQVQNVVGASSVNFTGLDGATDLAYELFGQFRWQSVGSDNHIYLRFNGDAGAGGRYVWVSAGAYYDLGPVQGANDGTNTPNGIALIRSNWNNDGYCTIRGIITAQVGGTNVQEYLGQAFFRADAAGPYISVKNYGGQYYSANANLTSLSINPLAGNVTGRFALRRLY